MTKRAMIAMSGGVDSAVAAWLTLREGWDTLGATAKMLDAFDPEDARATAHRLGIPFHLFDLREAFARTVMDAFVRSYEAGLTPNPCILCNREIKFGLLLDAALSLGCDTLVTGHYARILQLENGRYTLGKAQDASKDQSYFLACLTQDQLVHSHFPLGALTKAQVREIAQAQGFEIARKKDSQDICFIPDGDYRAFLEAFTGKTYTPGTYLDLYGCPVGTHRGAVGYTLGQRKGLGIALGEPVYVCSKDMQANTVTVGPDSALWRREFTADSWNWMAIPCPAGPIRALAKVRSRMQEAPATVFPGPDGTARILFDEPQRAITPGQAVVLYRDDLVLAGGTITKIES